MSNLGSHTPIRLLDPDQSYFSSETLSLSPDRLTSFPTPLPIIKGIPTERTATTIATFKPPKQTTPVEQVPTSPAPLTRQLPIRPNNAIANRALRLPLHRRRHVLPPRQQTVDQVAAFAALGVAEVNDALGRDEPAAPFLLVDADAVDAVDGGAGEWVGGGQVDGDLHCLFVDGDGGGDFAGGGGDFDVEGGVSGGLGGGPGADG